MWSIATYLATFCEGQTAGVGVGGCVKDGGRTEQALTQ